MNMKTVARRAGVTSREILVRAFDLNLPHYYSPTNRAWYFKNESDGFMMIEMLEDFDV